MHYSTSCNTQSSAPEDGQNNCWKHVELTGIINEPLLLHLVGCLYYLYQWCTVNQISDNEIYLLIKYIKSVLWRVAKRLSYIEDARCLKVKWFVVSSSSSSHGHFGYCVSPYLWMYDPSSPCPVTINKRCKPRNLSLTPVLFRIKWFILSVIQGALTMPVTSQYTSTSVILWTHCNI